MKISSALYTQSAQAIAEALFRAGQDLNGKNLRRASWQEIAEGLQDGKIASIIVQRLQMATTREDALRVLRIARKRVRVKKKSAGSRRLAAQSTPIVITDLFAQEDRDYQLYLECLRFEEEFEDALRAPNLLSRLSANTQDFSGLSPMQTGYELATLAMLREDYGLSFPLWLTDWGALANWYRKILRQARTRRKRTGCRILLYNPTRTGGGVTQVSVTNWGQVVFSGCAEQLTQFLQKIRVIREIRKSFVIYIPSKYWDYSITNKSRMDEFHEYLYNALRINLFNLSLLNLKIAPFFEIGPRTDGLSPTCYALYAAWLRSAKSFTTSGYQHFITSSSAMNCTTCSTGLARCGWRTLT